MDACQPTLLDAELERRASMTRRGEFLARLGAEVPWDRLERLVAPFYHSPRPGAGGRPPVPLPVMLRMYVLSVAYSLSDRACQDECNDSAAARAFVGLGQRDAPDETTLCKFRHLLESEGLGERMLAEVNAALAERGLGISAGTIVDATFVESPSSTKNRQKARDPEAHSAKKGNSWHFGYKAHVGVDAGSGTVHTLVVTAANASDVAEAHSLVREGDERVWADAGYVGVQKREEVVGDPALSRVEWLVARRRSTVAEGQRPYERDLSSVRSRVEHPFHVVKDIFRLRKVRYRGLRKVGNLLFAAFALANLVLARRRPRKCMPPASPAAT